MSWILTLITWFGWAPDVGMVKAAWTSPALQWEAAMCSSLKKMGSQCSTCGKVGLILLPGSCWMTLPVCISAVPHHYHLFPGKSAPHFTEPSLFFKAILSPSGPWEKPVCHSPGYCSTTFPGDIVTWSCTTCLEGLPGVACMQYSHLTLWDQRAEPPSVLMCIPN